MEEWRDIPNYEGLYQVSNLGNVRSYDRTIDYKFGRIYSKKGRILKPAIASHGYKTVALCIGKQISVCIHKAMALAFLPNPENLKCINHKNGIKTDNRIENLEWCTHSENNKHAYDIGLKKPSTKKRKIINLTTHG